MKEKIINGINYRLNDWTKTAEVIKKGGLYEGNIIIPETVVFNELTYRVTSIGKEAFAFCNPLTSMCIVLRHNFLYNQTKIHKIMG